MSALAAKATIGALQTLVIIGILLFLPARTFDYPQAWAYLALFTVAVVLITAYLLKNDPALLQRRITANVVAEKRPQEKLIQALAACAFASIFGLASLDHRFDWSAVPLWLSVLGGAMVAAGFYITFLAFRANSFAGSTIEIWDRQRVISTGPYAVVRHPMYSGALLMLYGTALELGSYWALVPVATLTVLIVVRSLDEERLLRQELPGYADYARSVRRRLIPLVW